MTDEGGAGGDDRLFDVAVPGSDDGPNLDPQLAAQFIAKFESYRGSFPHPQILAQLDQVVPGAAALAFDMANRQQEHRMDLERAVILGNVKSQQRGALFGFLIAVLGLGVAAILALQGQPGLAVALVLAEIVSLAGLFVWVRIAQTEELQQKSELMDEVAP